MMQPNHHDHNRDIAVVEQMLVEASIKRAALYERRIRWWVRLWKRVKAWMN